MNEKVKDILKQVGIAVAVAVITPPAMSVAERLAWLAGQKLKQLKNSKKDGQ